MRAASLVVVAAIGFLLGTGVAAAEKVRTNQSTKLLARPGEQAKVLLTVKSGQNMTLLNQEGRWLKVRVQGRTGFVPRSKVDMADDGGIARNTRRRPFVDGRGKRRGFGGEAAPDDRVGADALGDSGGGGGDEGDDEEEDEEDAPKPKKVAAKAPPSKAAASKGKDEDEEEEEDEEDEPPAKKAPAKAPAKAPVKVAAAAKVTPPAKGKEEDDEEEEEDDEDAKPAAKGGGDDEEEDEEDDTPSGKGGDDEDPIGGDKKDGEDEADTRPTAHVTSKKVSVREDPDDESEEQFVVGPNDMLYPMESKGSYTFVENAEGDGGWVPSDMLELEGSGGGGGGTGKRVIDLRARAGLTIIQQGMRTTGSNVLTVPDNYNIGTSSATLSIGAGILVPKGKWLVGGEFTYDYAKALGGGVPYDPDDAGPMPVVNTGITLHNVNVRALAGIDLKKKSGMALIGHLGYRYQGFLISDVADFTKNPAKLPSEVVKAPTLGAALAIPRLTDKIGIKFALDAILFAASVKQTVGLEDGGAPSVKAIVLGTDFTYKVTKSFDLMATYNLNYMSIDFGAPMMSSMRNHMGTSVTRTDIFHMITFGIAKPF